MATPYVLPNRKAFSDYVTRTFLKYRGKSKEGGNPRELFPHQLLIRDYLNIETPYRGLLIYHGLGSGKTCTSIAVAESLLSTKQVFVMLPASLEENYKGEIRKCGDPIYAFDQHWIERQLTAENLEEAKSLGISEEFLSRQKKFFVSVPGREPNYQSLDGPSKQFIATQIEDVIGKRFRFIRYNGLSNANIDKYAPKEGPNPYDNSVVIIDEVHNLISRVYNDSAISGRLYDRIYNAVNCKIVALSGTPIINSPNEISYLMNLLRGPIERITIPFTTAPVWDEEKMTNTLRAIPDVDNIEFNSVKKYVLITRNPPNFRSVYNEKGERIAVQYMKDMTFEPLANKWVESWKTKFETEVGGGQLAIERVTTEKLQCLPTDFKEFINMFLDGLNIKNPLLFQKRIQGLVSYFKGADEKVLPKRIDDDKMLEMIEMSAVQLSRYQEVRFEELRMDANKRRLAMNEDGGSYRVKSRLACNYVIPPDLTTLNKEMTDEDEVVDKSAILDKLRANPTRYLTEESLKSFSPKLLKLFQNLKGSLGENWNNQFVYSNYKTLEGLGIFAAILEANGWQEYKLKKEANQWIEDPTMDAEKPAFTYFVGAEDPNEREYKRQIFNGVGFSDNFPPSLRASVEKRDKKILCLFLGSSAAAEGITLNNVRHVHIMEPHWNPARHDQVIGRAIRINSHATLPEEERTVRVSFYVTSFPPQAFTETEQNMAYIRKNDTEMKYYGDQPTETFLTTDESLYNLSFKKEKIAKLITNLLKQSSVDCEVHRKLHTRGEPQLSCMRFDSTTTPEDIAFKPSYKAEDTDDTYLRNMTKRRRRLQQVQIKDLVFYIDPDTKQVFDGPAFEDNERLLMVGKMISPTKIQMITLTQ